MNAPLAWSAIIPRGPIAEAELVLMADVAALMLLTAIVVFALLIFFAWWYRKSNARAEYQPDWEHGALSELVWWAIPIEIVLVLGALTWGSTHALDPARPLQGDPAPIEVVALPWRWLFIYPSEGIATVNYLVIPAGKPVQFAITADAPMNSFWIPALGGQIYAMTGMITKLNLQANEPGEYAGSSANYSGEGFAGMRFTARALPQAGYDEWVRSVKQERAPLLDAARYAALASPSTSTDQISYSNVSPDLFGDIVEHFSGEAGAAHHPARTTGAARSGGH